MADFSGKLVSVIGDADTVTGFLLAGIGERNSKGTNFMIVDDETRPSDVLAFFNELTARDDIAIILINQHVAQLIRHALAQYEQTIPTVLEIPSKSHLYDPSKDMILKQVNMLLGGQ